jgi:hypothetical protein
MPSPLYAAGVAAPGVGPTGSTPTTPTTTTSAANRPAKGIRPFIARRGVDHGSGLGVHRWVVVQTLALLHWFRRLRVHWEIRDDIHEAFLSLACSIICWRRLQRHQSLR